MKKLAKLFALLASVTVLTAEGLVVQKSQLTHGSPILI